MEEDDNENFEDYNNEEDYNDYNEDEEENETKDNKNEIKEINLNEQNINDYEIIPNKEIIKKRDAIIEEFINYSQLTYDEAELVLIYYDWNYDKLSEYWFDNMEKIKIESHTEQSEESTKAIKDYFSQNNLPPNTCPICYNEYNPEETISLKCEHKMCKECYVEYITNKLLTEPNSILMTPCPLNGCNLYLTRTIFKKCITERKYQLIFAKSLVRNFIARNNNIKPCPNPKCNLSIRVPVSILKEIKCNCGFIFCFLCLEDSHIPCDCEMAKLWRESTKEKGSGEDFIWMRENTKNCPKCGINIEKNQGCNHMRCRRELGGCGHEFCWVCMQPWNSHIISSIDSFYTCSKPKIEEEKKKEKGYKIPEKFKTNFGGKKQNLLDRYIHFFQLWDSHKKNLDVAYKLKDRVKKFKNDLINIKKFFEIDVNFLDESLEMIIECNRLLKNIFVYEYFLDKNSNFTLFENNIEILQNQTDSLLELIELDQLPEIMKLYDQKAFQESFLKYKDHALALIKSTKTFKKNLLNEFDNNINAKFNYNAIKELDATLYLPKKSRKDKK